MLSDSIDIIDAQCYLTTEEFQRVLAESVYNPTKLHLSQRIKRYQNDRNIAIFAAIYDSKICGVLVANIACTHIVILDIAVISALQRNGIGKSLIKHLMMEYKPSEIYAQTDDDAVEFYARLGFEIHEIELEKNKTRRRYHCTYLCNYFVTEEKCLE